MDTLLNVEQVTSQYNLKGLRHLHDLMESNIRSLNSLGVSFDSFGALLSSVLMNKLPPELRLIASHALLKVLEDEVQARECTAPKPSSEMKQSWQRGNSPGKEQASAAALLSGNSHGHACCYCKQSHPSRACQVVVGAEARLLVLRKTDQASVFNPSNTRISLRVRIVLDTGSQKSYVTERLKRDLTLMPDGEHEMSIVTFGAKHGKPHHCEYMNVGLTLSDGQSKMLTLFSVSTICEPISLQPIAH